MKKKQIGLFFGSFNPIHIGHLIVANHFVEYCTMQEVWLVLSPQNPFKSNKELLNENLRWEMLNLALKGYKKLKPSNVEFGLEKPSYTIKTLEFLQQKYPDVVFSILIGEDNLENFKLWKDYEKILEKHQIYVYPRDIGGFDKQKMPNNFLLLDAPKIEISSTFIRHAIQSDKNAKPYLPAKVFDYITENNLYQN